jgi:hypothetical protein
MSTNVGIGFRGFLGYGEESTYGTTGTRTHYLEILNESLQASVARIETQALVRRGVHSNRVASGAKSISGNIEFEATYDGWMKLAKQAFGRIDNTSPDPTNAPTAKQHKFTIADTLPTGLTFEIFRDTTDFVTEANKSFLYKGCKINTMEFSCGVDELLKINCGIMGQDDDRATKTTNAFTSSELAVYHEGIVTWGSTELPVESFSIQLNNNLEMRPKLGSRLTREPLPSGKVEVTGTFAIEFDTWAQYDDFKNATYRQLDLSFTGDVIASTTYNKIRFLCTVADLVDARVTLDQVGRLRMEIDFKAYRGDNINELELYCTNTGTGY